MRWTIRSGFLSAAVSLLAPLVASAQESAYWTEVALEANSCENVTVQPGLTKIVRGAGSDSLTVTHAGQAYTGVLLPDGQFTTTPRDLVFGSTTYSIGISGKLEGDGLSALVTVSMREAGSDRSCRYTVRWTGRKR